PTEPIGPRPWLAATALGILCTGLGYAVFYRLIQRIGARAPSSSPTWCRCSRWPGPGCCWASR
ncbi:hypothetical protein ACLEQD_28730, partial [Corallococcus sp. 4LFB]